MRFIKQISILLLFSFSVLLGHSVVPHHHHTENVNLDIKGECPIDHPDRHNEEDHQDNAHHPIHCHAFNSLAFVNYSYSEIQQPVRVIPLELVQFSRIGLEKPIHFKIKQVIFLKIPDKKTKYMGAISMRAPPVSA